MRKGKERKGERKKEYRGVVACVVIDDVLTMRRTVGYSRKRKTDAWTVMNLPGYIHHLGYTINYDDDNFIPSSKKEKRYDERTNERVREHTHSTK
jgi:hypothetical protein